MNDALTKYRWPWVLLLFFIFGCALAVLWMLAEVKRTKQIRGYSNPPSITSERSLLEKINPEAILKSVRLCAQDFKKHGEAVPAMLTLNELVQRGFLRTEDAGSFEGMAVFVSLTADALHPQEILMEVRLPDGHKVVALADGSVQER